MASKEAAPAEEKPAPAKKPWLLIGAMAVIGALGGGAGTVFLLPKSAPPAAENGHGGGEAAQAGGGEHGGGEGHGDQGSFADRVVQLDPFVVNVSAEGYPRYLKVTVAFEMSAPEAKADLEERVAQVRDLTILLLSSKRLADLEDFEGKALLKDDLREQVNALLHKGRVESVLFTEFVVQ
jgi:flagellar FliL protein